MYQKKLGNPIDGVAISDQYNQGDKVGYAIGLMKEAKNKENAQKFLQYLATDKAQDIYAGYGFGKASAADLTNHPF